MSGLLDDSTGALSRDGHNTSRAAHSVQPPKGENPLVQKLQRRLSLKLKTALSTVENSPI